MSRNLNTPCTLVNDVVLFVSDCIPYLFNLRKREYERLDVVKEDNKSERGAQIYPD